MYNFILGIEMEQVDDQLEDLKKDLEAYDLQHDEKCIKVRHFC